MKSNPAAAVLKILVVEDDYAVGACIVDMLELLLGADVDRTPSGQHGMRKLRRERFGLAIIDSGLPDARGVEVARAAVDNNTPVLLVSGHPNDIFEFDQFNLPHLAKPFSLTQLMAASQKALGDADANIRRVRAALAAMPANNIRLQQVSVEWHSR